MRERERMTYIYLGECDTDRNIILLKRSCVKRIVRDLDLFLSIFTFNDFKGRDTERGRERRRKRERE